MEAQNSTSNIKTLFLFLISMFVTIIGGALTGIAVAIVSSLIYLIFLFPVGMGFIGGILVMLGVRLAKIRRISQVVFLSFLVTICIYGTYHYVKYVYFRAQAFAELSSKLSKVSDDNKVDAARTLIDYALVKETGHSGFVGYILFKAQRGVSLDRATSSNSVNMGPTLTWAYWLVEIGIIFWMAMSLGRQEAKVPVCEVCGSRLGKEKHLGGTTPANESLLLDLIRSRQFVELGKLIEKNEDLPSTELYMQRCESCGKGNAYVTISRASRTSKGGVQLSRVQNVMLSPGDSVLFAQELKFNN